MEKEDIEFIKSLDPSCTDGTIQFFLMEEKFKVAPFEEVAKHLLRQLIREKRYLAEQNTELSRKLYEFTGERALDFSRGMNRPLYRA